MSEDARWLDGNALGGLLQELFGVDLTGAPHRCESCGTERPVAGGSRVERFERRRQKARSL